MSIGGSAETRGSIPGTMSRAGGVNAAGPGSDREGLNDPDQACANHAQWARTGPQPRFHGVDLFRHHVRRGRHHDTEAAPLFRPPEHEAAQSLKNANKSMACACTRVHTGSSQSRTYKELMDSSPWACSCHDMSVRTHPHKAFDFWCVASRDAVLDHGVADRTLPVSVLSSVQVHYRSLPTFIPHPRHRCSSFSQRRLKGCLYFFPRRHLDRTVR